MKKRVVITGIGIVAPNGVGKEAFKTALENGTSGIKFDQQLADLNFSCTVSGKPDLSPEYISAFFTDYDLRNFNASGILYGVIAGMQAWKDAGLPIASADEPDWDSGTIFGCSTSGIEKFRESIYKIDDLQTRRLGTTVVAQTMNSGVSAYLAGKLGLGNQVTTNSSACITGTESLLSAFERVQSGRAIRMLSGSTSDSGPYIWAGFDAIKVCTFRHNNNPEIASRPMSQTASGFVPSSGAGAFVVEELESALARNATIYAEILGGNVNSGGQRGSGTMTAPNSQAVQKCIQEAVKESGINPNDIDVINAHLTATSKDATEIENWSKALNRSGANFPYINALKGMVGHCLSAAGSIELVSAILEIYHDFIFPSVNCADLHPEITKLITSDKVPQKVLYRPVDILIKASFGFGDVNACVILKKFKNE
jgi:3-oxoacyl-(acyl-carrier-protein) synthase